MRRYALVLAFVIGTVGGCGYSGNNPTNVVKVQGTLLKADGKPAAWVSLEFYPKSTGMAAAFATVGADGKFTPKTMDKEGMIPGPYKVVATPQKKSGATPLPAAYGNEQLTPLEATVSSSGGELKVQLK